MSVTISTVRSRAERDEFIRMAWTIYDGDPVWVPPLLADRHKLLDPRRNPFFEHAEIELFIARRDGRAVGRIAAIVNRRHNEVHADRLGFFGFFESVDDQEVANALFAVAEHWLAERGMEAMRGPVNPSINDEVGLLVEGFDDPPQIMTTYNPRYYRGLIESAGLVSVKELYAYRLLGGRFVTDKLSRVQRLVRERYGVTVRTIRFKPHGAFREDIETVKRIYAEAWEANWGAVALTDGEFESLAADLKQIAEPRSIVFAQIDGRTVGFGLGIPDINQVLIRNRRGGMIGAGLRMLFKRPRITRGRILVLGVLPEFQRRGIDAVLYYEVGTAMIDGLGYTEGEASWILEDNVMMTRAAELMDGVVYKRYRLFEKTMNKN